MPEQIVPVPDVPEQMVLVPDVPVPMADVPQQVVGQEQEEERGRRWKGKGSDQVERVEEGMDTSAGRVASLSLEDADVLMTVVTEAPPQQEPEEILTGTRPGMGQLEGKRKYRGFSSAVEGYYEDEETAQSDGRTRTEPGSISQVDRDREELIDLEDKLDIKEPDIEEIAQLDNRTRAEPGSKPRPEVIVDEDPSTESPPGTSVDKIVLDETGDESRTKEGADDVDRTISGVEWYEHDQL